MDIQRAAKSYVDFMVASSESPKAMLIDEDTSKYISPLYTQSEMALASVYYIDLLDAFDNREPVPQFDCVVFVRPTQRNIAVLCKELKDPFFQDYFLFFVGVLTRRDLELIAASDLQQRVQDIREVYLDFHALRPSLFSMETDPRSTSYRVVDGILAAMAALKHRPVSVRYQRSSEHCLRLADGLSNAVANHIDIFTQEPLPECTVLIVDRSEDACTPLLTPWTYEAMLHEFLGMELNTVVIDKKKQGRMETNPEDNEFVFSPDSDEFYRENMHTDWGTLCTEVQKMVEAHQASVSARATAPGGADTVDGIRDRISRLPSMQRASSNVTKHVECMAKIGSAVRVRDLFAIGAFEQDLVLSHSPKEHFRVLSEIVERHASGKPDDIVRLALLFVLKYETESLSAFEGGAKKFTKSALYALSAGTIAGQSKESCVVEMVLDLLRANEFGYALGRERLNKFLERFGAKARCVNTMGSGNASILKSVIGAMKISGEDDKSMYTQYEPFVTTLAKMAADESLPLEAFPDLLVQYPKDAPAAEEDPDRDIFIFMVGGLTYTEVHALQRMALAPMKKAGGLKNHFEFLSLSDTKSKERRAGGTLRVVAGTNRMLTTRSFLEQF